MPKRLLVLLTLSALLPAGTAAAGVRTFGLDGDAAALAARPQAEWVRHARILEKRRDWAGLLAWGENWARGDPDNPLAWFVQGRALAEQGRFTEAIEAYRQNLRLAPGDVFALNNLGNAYRDSGHSRAAMVAYRAAAERAPDYVAAWHNLGLTFYLAKGEAGVARALDSLRATDPQLAAVWHALALEYAITRDERVARDAVRVLRSLSRAERKRMFDILFEEG